MEVPSLEGDVKIVSSISTFVLPVNTLTLKKKSELFMSFDGTMRARSEDSYCLVTFNSPTPVPRVSTSSFLSRKRVTCKNRLNNLFYWKAFEICLITWSS